MTSRVAVLTDSSSDLDPLLADQLHIHLLLLSVNFDRTDWLDHSDLDAQTMFSRLKARVESPSLRLPTAQHYLRVIDNLLQKHDHVFALHSSPTLGQVYQFALQVLQGTAQAERVTVFSSGSTSSGLAMQAQRAARLFHEGHTPQRVSEVLNHAQSLQHTYLTLSTLEYLRRARLINPSLAALGEIQNIRPILTLEEGRIVPEARPRGEAQALEYNLKLLRQFATDHPEGRISFISNGAQAAVDTLRAEAKRLRITEFLNQSLGLVLSSYVGPDAYGFTVEPLHIWHKFERY